MQNEEFKYKINNDSPPKLIIIKALSSRYCKTACLRDIDECSRQKLHMSGCLPTMKWSLSCSFKVSIIWPDFSTWLHCNGYQVKAIEACAFSGLSEVRSQKSWWSCKVNYTVLPPAWIHGHRQGLYLPMTASRSLSSLSQQLASSCRTKNDWWMWN